MLKVVCLVVLVLVLLLADDVSSVVDVCECRPSMSVGAADRTCSLQRVCFLSASTPPAAQTAVELIIDDDASLVDASQLDTPLAHLGSYSTSLRVKLRHARSDAERARLRMAVHVAEPSFLVTGSNAMFWHWIGDEFFSLFWLMEFWLGQRVVSGAAPLPVRVVLLERLSAHATQLVSTVTSRPLLLITSANEAPLAADASTVELVRDVCFERVYVGPASRQLGGPGSKYVDAALVARFAAFVARSNQLPAAPPAAERALLLFDYRLADRRISNLDAVRAAFDEQFRSAALDVQFANMASLARRQQLQLLQRASIYIAVHGSAFANVLWLPPSGAQVLEIFPFGFERPTYESVCRKYLPHVRYHRWQNPDRSAAQFDRSILERHGVAAAEMAQIVDAPAYDYRMSWSANFYWINQDTRLPVAPSSTFMTLVAQLVATTTQRERQRSEL